MDNQPLRDRILICVRSRTWRSYRKICIHTCGRGADLEVRTELARMLGEGLIDFWDNSLRRFKLTCSGMNAAKRAWEKTKPGTKRESESARHATFADTRTVAASGRSKRMRPVSQDRLGVRHGVALDDINAAKNVVAAGLAETQNGRGEWVSRVVSMGTGVPFVEASTTGASPGISAL